VADDLVNYLLGEWRLEIAHPDKVNEEDGGEDGVHEEEDTKEDTKENQDLRVGDQAHGVVVVCWRVSSIKGRPPPINNTPFTQTWSFLASGCGVGGPPSVAEGPWGKN
jgi:hypothetical protein